MFPFFVHFCDARAKKCFFNHLHGDLSEVIGRDIGMLYKHYAHLHGEPECLVFATHKGPLCMHFNGKA